MSVKDDVIGILQGAALVYEHSLPTFMNPRGGTVLKELKDLAKANPTVAELKTMPKIVETLCKLAEAQWKTAAKLNTLSVQVRDGKLSVDKAIPVANKVVADIVKLNSAVVAYDRGWRDLPDNIQKKAMFLKVYANNVSTFENYWGQHKSKMTLVHPPARATTAAPVQKPARPTAAAPGQKPPGR
jgi:hypothetical protein